MATAKKFHLILIRANSKRAYISTFYSVAVGLWQNKSQYSTVMIYEVRMYAITGQGRVVEGCVAPTYSNALTTKINLDWFRDTGLRAASAASINGHRT